jgi:hypothetical protein
MYNIHQNLIRQRSYRKLRFLARRQVRRIRFQMTEITHGIHENQERVAKVRPVEFEFDLTQDDLP